MAAGLKMSVRRIKIQMAVRTAQPAKSLPMSIKGKSNIQT